MQIVIAFLLYKFCYLIPLFGNSNMDLTEIPDEIRELQHITILSKDLINNSSLKLFLYGNRLTKLSMQLFSLKNLSVLSLRKCLLQSDKVGSLQRHWTPYWSSVCHLGNNKLETIPPEIVLLQNLCELSLGNNMLVSANDECHYEITNAYL